MFSSFLCSFFFLSFFFFSSSSLSFSFYSFLIKPIIYFLHSTLSSSGNVGFVFIIMHWLKNTRYISFYIIAFYYFFSFWAIPWPVIADYALKNYFLVVRGLYGTSVIKHELAKCKTQAQSAVLSFQSYYITYCLNTNS